jgi:hypothetical protein
MSDSAELAIEVQRLLENYVKGSSALDELQDALDALAPKLAELPSDKYAVWAVDHAEILIAEVLRAHRSEDEVRLMIRDEILLPSAHIVQSTAASSASPSDAPSTSRPVLTVGA